MSHLYLRVASVLVISVLSLVGCTNTISQTTSQTSKVTTGNYAMSEQVSPPGLLKIGVASDNPENNPTLVTFSVTNTSVEPFQWLVWNTPLEVPLSADVFIVQLNGVHSEYQGRLVKRGTPSPENYVTLAGKELIQATIDLSQYYDMSSSGTYDVTLNIDKLTAQYRPEAPQLTLAEPNTIQLLVP